MTRTDIQQEEMDAKVSTNLALLLQGVGQVAVGIREMRLKFYGSLVCVNSQLNQAKGNKRWKERGRNER